MPSNKAFDDINSISLFKWLDKTPYQASWWLQGSILILLFLTLNTIVCSIESILKKRDKRQLLLTISPQIIHIGFLFALVAHLVNGMSSYHQYLLIQQGRWTFVKPGLELAIKDIEYSGDPRFMTDLKADIYYNLQDGKVYTETISPNNPFFINGLGIYLQRISMYPSPSASIEVSHEPGAIWAFIGALLFTIGTVAMVVLKMRDDSIET